MATQFHLHFMEGDAQDLDHVAGQCFERLDELEAKLSRFIPDSDISRINNMKADQSLMIDYETYYCLKAAIEIQQQTQGAFDIGVGEFMNIFRGLKDGVLNMSEHNNALKQALKEKQEGSIYLDPDEHKIYCINPGIQFDLGALGKGYAVDTIAEMLHEMGYENFSISASESTILVSQNGQHNQSFKYKLVGTENESEVILTQESVSASGTFWQGNHIFDPRTGNNSVSLQFERMWVCAKNALLSDAFSTALFLMNKEEVENILYSCDDINWIGYSQEGQVTILNRV